MRLNIKNAIFIFDFDDTLSDTYSAHRAGIAGIAQCMGTEFAKKVDELFFILLKGFRVQKLVEWEEITGGRIRYGEVLVKISQCQKGIRETWGTPRLWSKEALIKVAGDELWSSFSLSLACEIADLYWERRSQASAIFEHARECLRWLKDHGRPFYVLTDSDSRLRLIDSEFTYEPAYSESFKRKRIELLLDDIFSPNAIIIGDPEAKPSRAIFDKALRFLSYDIGNMPDPSRLAMVGDSYGGDIQTPIEKLGFGLGVLFQRNASFGPMRDNVIRLGALSDIRKIFS